MKKILFAASFTAALLAHTASAQLISMPKSAVSASDNNAPNVAASGQTQNGEGADRLFDSSTGTKWCLPHATGTQVWAVYQFTGNDRWAVTNYTLVAVNNVSEAARDPMVWWVEGSNDLVLPNTGSIIDAARQTAVNNATWELVHAQTNTAYLTGPTTGPRPFGAVFDCSHNAKAYNAYRLRIFKNQGNNSSHTQIAEWEMTGHSGFMPGYFEIASLGAINVTTNSANTQCSLYTVGTAVDVFMDWGEGPADLTNTVQLAGGPFLSLTNLVHKLDNLEPETKYYYRHRGEGGGSAVTSAVTRAFTTKSLVAPELTMLSAVNGLVYATVTVDIESFGKETTGSVTLFCGPNNHETNLDAWLADINARRTTTASLGIGVHALPAFVPAVAGTLHCRAFAFNSTETGAAPNGLTLASLLSAITDKRHFAWAGRVSNDWNNTNNWVDSNTLLHPASMASLTGGDRNLLLGPAPHAPSNQNIPGLEVNTIHFQCALPIVINNQAIKVRNQIYRVAGSQIVTFNNEVSFSGAGTESNCMRGSDYIFNNKVTEYNGSKRLIPWDGTVRFYGPVETTGGFGSTSCQVHFYGVKTTGIPPAAFVPNYFNNNAQGGLYFNFPLGVTGSYDYDFNTNTGAQAWIFCNIPTDVTVRLNAPVAQGGHNGIDKLNSVGILELNGHTNTFTGAVRVMGGLVILQNGLSRGSSMQDMITAGVAADRRYSEIRGSIDLNGVDFLGRNIAVSNAGSYDGDGYLRNQNPDRESLFDGNMTNLLSGAITGYDSAFRLGGIGDLRHTGIIGLVGQLPVFLAKGGPGKLILAGETRVQCPTYVHNGTLVLDYEKNPLPKLGGAAQPLHLCGSLTLLGNPDQDITETVGALNHSAQSGALSLFYNKVRIAPSGNGVRTTTFRFGNYAPGLENRYFLVDFAPGPNGRVATTAANVSTLGSMQLNCVWNGGESFARVGAAIGGGYNEIEKLPDAAYSNAFTSATNYEIVDIAGNMAVASEEIAAGIRFNDPSQPATLTLNANLKLLADGFGGDNAYGAVLVTPGVGANTSEITGTGVLTPCIGGGAVAVHQYNTGAPLIIRAPVMHSTHGSNSSALNKAGPGKLILTNADSRFDHLNIHEGVLEVSEVADIGVNSPIGKGRRNDNAAAPVLLGDGTFRYVGPGHSMNRQFLVRGFGVIEASGSGPLKLTAKPHLLTAGGAGGANKLLTLSGAGNGIIEGSLDNLLDGRLRKRGSGTWTLNGNSSNIIWGAEIFDGTLVLNGSLGRDVTVHGNGGPTSPLAAGTLSGTGIIRRDLTLENNATLKLTPNAPLVVGKNLVIAAGAKLVLPSKLPADWAPVLDVRGQITGAFNYPATAHHKIEDGVIFVKDRPIGTLLMVR